MLEKSTKKSTEQGDFEERCSSGDQAGKELPVKWGYEEEMGKLTLNIGILTTLRLKNRRV